MPPDEVNTSLQFESSSPDVLMSSLIFISIVVVNQGIVNQSSWTSTSAPKQLLPPWGDAPNSLRILL